MKARNQKALSLSTLSPYPVQLRSSGDITFATDHQVRYKLSFTRNRAELPNTTFADNCLTLTIVPLSGYVYYGPFAGIADPRVAITIMDQIVELFQSNPSLVLNYTCDLADELERNRKIAFGTWYKTYLKPMGVERIEYDNPSGRVHAAALYWHNHPDRAEVEEIFNEIFVGK